MSHTVSGKLHRDPFVKSGCGQDGQSTMFAVELSEMNKHYQTGEKSYTNYKAMFFAKSQAALDYYNKAFAKGSFIVVDCEKLSVDVSPCGQYIKLQMENARMSGANFAETSQPAPQQQSWGSAPQNAPQAPTQQAAPQMAPAYQPAPQTAPAQRAPQQQAPTPNHAATTNPNQKPAPTQYNEPSMDFDDDIPF